MKKLIKTGIAALLVGLSFSAFGADEDIFVTSQNFQSLFNSYRYAQPKLTPWAGSYFPYSENGTAIAMAKYDQLFNAGQMKASKFEEENHSCDQYTGEEKTSCQGWWGHCNGWAAAALKEIEPVKAFTFKNTDLGIGHQKGILSELWLSNTSYFVGGTDKSKKTEDWVFNPNDSNYSKFWDVTPRQLFLIFTNQIGAMKVGVVIDRFTGDQVWNQPIAGYLILPIRQSDIGVKDVNGKSLNYADIRMKIFWAEDGVPVDHVSDKFVIDPVGMGSDQDGDMSVTYKRDYTSRMLSFKLFFDQPLQVSGDGLKILNNPKIVGNGIWKKQEEEDYSGLDQGHPDFIWQAINPRIVNDGYANPYINWNNIQEITAAYVNQNEDAPPQPPVTPPQPPVTPVDPGGDFAGGPNVFTAVIDGGQTAIGGTRELVQKMITKVFKRASLNIHVNAALIEITGNKVQFRMFAADGITTQEIVDAFADAGVTTISVQ